MVSRLSIPGNKTVISDSRDTTAWEFFIPGGESTGMIHERLH